MFSPRLINNQMTKMETQIKELEKKIPPPITNNQSLARQLQAFAVSSQVASDKYGTNPNTDLYADLRTVVIDGKTFYPYLFSKVLKHDQTTGMSESEDMDAIIRLCQKENISVSDLQNLSIHLDPLRVRVLEGINCGNSFIIQGVDTKSLFAAFPPIADSVQGVCEMMEVYEMSFLRDTSFLDIQLEANSDIKRALRTINNYLALGAYSGPGNSGTGTVTGKELFRGRGVDETVGPYVSQFLIHDVNYNSLNLEQKFPSMDNATASTNYEHFLNIQRGIVFQPSVLTDPKYVSNGRTAGAIVHRDPLYYFYFNASNIMIAFYPIYFKLTYAGIEGITSSWTDMGGPDFLGALADVTIGALRVAWNSKWNKYLKIRPEALAARIENIRTGVFSDVPFFDTLKENCLPGIETLSENFSRTQTHLLELLYPEGSPTHPSYPAGHATVAGACATIIKAFVKTHDEAKNALKWPLDVLHSVDGTEKVNYDLSDKSDVTIVGEINKLASNISYARNYAGVHYRADGFEGNKLGEEFAIKYLQVKLKEYTSVQNNLRTFFELQKFDGQFIKIYMTKIEVV